MIVVNCYVSTHITYLNIQFALEVEFVDVYGGSNKSKILSEYFKCVTENTRSDVCISFSLADFSILVEKVCGSWKLTPCK